MASSLDVVNTAKNIVTALNQLGQTYLAVVGNLRSSNLAPSTTTLIASGPGRIVRISIINPSGSTKGAVYDSTSVSTPLNQLGVILPTEGIFEWGVPFLNGLVVTTAAGMNAVVVYSVGP